MKKFISFAVAFSLMFVLFDFPTDVVAADSATDDSVAIDETNFPDEQFRNFIKQKFDTNNDNLLSAEERGKQYMSPYDSGFFDIKSFMGIEFFNQLRTFEYKYLENFNTNVQHLTEN